MVTGNYWQISQKLLITSNATALCKFDSFLLSCIFITVVIFGTLAWLLVYNTLLAMLNTEVLACIDVLSSEFFKHQLLS
jgi:hypothetical protein